MTSDLATLLVTLAVFSIATCEEAQISERSVIDHLLNFSVYDASIHPAAITGTATEVEIDLVLNSIGPVDDIDMVMGASFFLRQQWTDPRLRFSHMLNHTIVINERKLPLLWVPDLYFPQSTTKEALHVITTPNILIRVSPEGSILLSQRLSVTVQCKMDLTKFPMDRQSCFIRMESYGYTTKDLFFTWSSRRAATTVQPNAYIPDFTVTNTSTHDCTAVYETGSFTCVEARLDLKREVGFYATQTYIPSILIVVLSWASFWIDHEAVPARISVGLLTVLTITTQSSGARAQLPRVPYVKAIDVWMSLCLVFVFAAYMEYAVVTVLSRRFKRIHLNLLMKYKENMSKSTTMTSDTDPENGVRPDEVHIDENRPRLGKDTGRFVDKLSRFLFPFSFLVFNIVYWVYYIHGP